jgi:hypothetical protein
VQRDTYVALLGDLLSQDPQRIKQANRTLFDVCVEDGGNADIALAEVAVHSETVNTAK